MSIHAKIRLRQFWGHTKGYVRGYYLATTVGSTETRHWFGSTADEAREHYPAACEQWAAPLADRHHGVRISLEYSHGRDIHGRPQWDLTV